MSPVRFRIYGSRRPLAVGIWSFLVVPMAIAAPGVSFAPSFGIMLIVSIMSTAALLLLIEEHEPGRRSHPAWCRHVPIAVSILIPVAWSILLGVRSSPSSFSAFAVIAVCPVGFAAITRTSPRFRQRKLTPPHIQMADATSQLTTSSVDVPQCHSNDANQEEPTVRFAEINRPQFGESSVFSEPNSSDITQWLTRSQTADGDTIEGGVRIEFASGQRDVTVHISFCPPFAKVPSVTTEDLDAVDLEIRVAATFPFGARLTVRRSAVSKSSDMPNSIQSCRIGFVAVADPVRRAA